MLSKKVLLGITMFSLLFLGATNIAGTYAEEEKDECDGVGTNHGDNSPSEKRFFKILNEKTLCDVVDEIDGMEAEGSIQEDTKHDWEWFTQTRVFQEKPEELSEEGFENFKICAHERYHEFPESNGDFHLAEYEIDNCGRGDY